MTDRADAIRYVLWNATFTILAVVVASALWWPIYQVGQFVLLAAVALALGVTIAALGSRFRLPGVAVLGITVGVYLIVGVPLAMPDAALFGVLPTWQGLVDLVQGTASSWKQLVTILLPVGTYQGLLIPPLVSILSITVITLSIALRTRRPELAVVWPMLLAVLGIAFGPAVGWQSVALGLAVPVVALIWLVWLGRSRHRARAHSHTDAIATVSPSRRERRRAAVVSVVSASLILALAACGGAVMASVSPATTERQVIRSHIEQPFNPRSYPSPLSGFRSFHLPDAAGQEMLTVSGLPSEGRLRLATLDTYDGVVYTVGTEDVAAGSGTFVRVPYRLDQQASGQIVTLDVTIRGYSGIWLPGAGQLRQIDFDGPRAGALSSQYFYNDVTGTSAVVTGLTDGDSYQMEAVVAATPTLDELTEIRPGSASPSSTVDLPNVMTERLELYTEGITGAGERLVSMLDGLKNDGYISHGVGENEPTSLSGHGLDRITTLFTERPMIGDEEQYAVAAALMARQLGFPARVVMGFVPTADPASDTATVSSTDISAWIEVQSSDGTWLTVDTTPPLREIPEKELDEPTKVSRPQSVVQPPLEQSESDSEQIPADDSVDNDDEPLDPLLAALLLVAQVLGWTLLGLAVLASPFLAVMAAKARRRALRRSRRTPSERIRAGWQEFQDSAIDFGIEPPASATRREVARTVGGKRALALASVADRATFSTERPSDEDADRVWAAVDDLRSSLGRGRTRRQRLQAATSLRSLGIAPRRSR
ncbi:hypothetical protein L1277_001720 [Okibacterium sp. HSC-33S16]|uniref:DUF4129 domain-containing transglutaminase family protein n=1 Tax=Okibacterium sp. HSC-33S16 TaxID=2910965 RepID=UPI00209FD4F4|nr:transglutaminase domain-containing protein [Okibacterium sp. HSC-33S16]MCP2031622.1 hypothetical protein [Okibacterium sp. HSC-33S16]